MKQEINVLIAAILIIFAIPGTAQKTNVNIRVNSSYLKGWTDGSDAVGRIFTVNFVDLYIGTQKIGSLNLDDTKPPYTITHDIVSLTDTFTTINFKFNYRYFTWPPSKEEVKTVDFNTNVSFDQYGIGKHNYKGSFLGLINTSERYAYFDISVTPFQPSISVFASKKCYNLPIQFTALAKAAAGFDTTGYAYTWQYGTRDSYYWVNDPGFMTFKDELASKVSTAGNLSSLFSIVYNTNYDFLKDIGYVVTNYEQQKKSIANTILAQIVAQNGSMSFTERIVLQSVFVNTFVNMGYYVPPYDQVWVYTWNNITETGKTITFNPSKYLSSLSGKKTLFFRTRATNVSGTGPWSDNGCSVDIYPGPPTAASVTPRASCAASQNGSVEITGITSPVPNAQFTWRLGNATTADYVSVDSAQNVSVWTQTPIAFTGNNITIPSGAGEKKIYLSYEDPSIRGCLAAIKTTVGTLPNLTYSASKTDVTCPNGSDGKIAVTINTHAGDYPYIIFNEVEEVDEAAYTFTGLSKGDYTVTVYDDCTSETVSQTITAPTAVTIDRPNVTLTQPNCLSPANGGFKLSATGGSGTFDYYIYKSDKTLLHSFKNRTGALDTACYPAGSYYIKALNTALPSCPGDTVKRILQPFTALGLTINTPTNVTCYGKSNGAVTATATGGMGGNYYYKIKDAADSTLSGSIGNLTANHYMLVAHNESESCNDTVQRPFTIKPGNQITITPAATDFKCNGSGDGALSATISQTITTDIDEYAWQQKQSDDTWLSAYSSQSATATDTGTYRLYVKDKNACEAVSDSVIVNQPAILVLGTPILNDIKCLGETGSLTLSTPTKGGNNGYTYKTSKDDGNTWQDYTLGSGLAAGDYYLQVTDTKNCQDATSDALSITQPDEAFTYTLTKSDYNGKNIRCNGDNNGSITIEATGGNGGDYDGYTYKANAVQQNTNVFSNLYAGTYNLSVTDARGCEKTDIVTLSEPNKVTLSVASKTDVKCYGDLNGAITLTGGGGVNPLTYSKDDVTFTPSNIFSGLAAGNYHLYVKDANSCKNDVTPTVAQLVPTTTVALDTVKDIRCFGENNGYIAATIGGSGNYDILWEKRVNSTWQFQQTGSTRITGLDSATYRIRVADKAVCPPVFASATIKQPDTLKFASVTMHDIRCLGETGSIDLLAKGGNNGYVYEYSRNSNPFTTYTPGSPLTAATYQMRVRDSKGCTTGWPVTYNITEPSKAFSYTFVQKDYNGSHVSCYGNTDGRLSVMPTGGNGATYLGYTYLLSGKPAQPDSVFDNLGAGNYTLTVNDARGCTIVKPVTLLQPASALNLAVTTLVPAKCFNDTTGRITLTASGGNGSYTYSIDSVNFISSPTFSKLSVGNYRLFVKDKNGCRQRTGTSVTHIHPVLTTSLTPEDIRCYNENSGKIGSTLTGGSGSFGLVWQEKLNNHWTFKKADSLSISALEPGFYRLEVTDKAGCPPIYDSTNVYQKVTELLIDTVTLSDIRCFGETGSIKLGAHGGNGMYTWYCSTAQAPAFAYTPGSPLTAAAYQVKVRDKKGCETTWPQAVTVTSPDQPLAFTYTLKQYQGGWNVSCFGNNNGQLDLHPTGGNGSHYSGYTYHFPDKDIQNDNVFRNLYAGTYNVSVTDNRGCSTIQAITLTQPASQMGLSVSSLENVTCHYDSTGTVTLSATGGQQPYTYSIGSNAYISDNRFYKLPVGKYTFTAKDINGCATMQLDTAIHNTSSKIQISGSVKHVTCFGLRNGSVNIQNTGGTAPFSYLWKETNHTLPGLVNVPKGSYTLAITDAKGCIAEQVFDIRQPAAPLSLTAASSSACDQLNNGKITSTATGGTRPYRYAVNDTITMQSDSILHSFGGNQLVCVADSNNCRATTSIAVAVRNIKPAINFMVATSRYALDSLVIKDVSIPQPDSITWVFAPEAKVVIPATFAPCIQFNSKGVYPVKMIGHFGTCDYELEKSVNIAPFDPAVYAQNKNQTGIESVDVYPNPNNGQFKLTVKLYTKEQTAIRVVDMYSKVWYTKSVSPCTNMEEDITLPDAVPGTYLIMVVCETDAQPVRFIISK